MVIYIADNLNFEFSALGYIEDGKKKYDLSTSLSDKGDINGSKRADELGDKLRKHFHNHPNDIANPSDPTNCLGDGDDKTFSEKIRQKAESCKFYIYSKTNGGAYRNYSFKDGKMNVTDERPSSFIKTSKGYNIKQGAIFNAFSF